MALASHERSLRCRRRADAHLNRATARSGTFAHARRAGSSGLSPARPRFPARKGRLNPAASAFSAGLARGEGMNHVAPTVMNGALSTIIRQTRRRLQPWARGRGQCALRRFRIDWSPLHGHRKPRRVRCLMFGFGKFKRIAAGVKDIQAAIMSQSYVFADLVAKEVDAIRSDLNVPMYTKILTRDRNTVSCIDQISFSDEAMAFYLNVLARTCYSTSKRDSAGTIILNTTVSELLEYFAKAAYSLKGGDIYDFRHRLHEFFRERNSQYSSVKSLLGTDIDDKSSALQHAGVIIAKEAQPDLIENLTIFFASKGARDVVAQTFATEFLQTVVRTSLLRGIKDMELSQRVESLLPYLE